MRIINKIKSFWYLYQKVANIYKENDNKCSLSFATDTKCTNSFYHTPIFILMYSNHSLSDSTIFNSINNTHMIVAKYYNLEQLDITKGVIIMSHFIHQVRSMSLK